MQGKVQFCLTQAAPVGLSIGTMVREMATTTYHSRHYRLRTQLLPLRAEGLCVCLHITVNVGICDVAARPIG